MSEKLLDLVAEYEQVGLRCFPVGLDKRPFEEWTPCRSEDSSARIGRFRQKLKERQPFLIAAIPGDKFCVVDVDDATLFDNWLASVGVSDGFEFDAPGVLTPSLGYHLWFRLDRKLKTQSFAWGELRSGGGSYVVVPGGGAASYEKKGKRIKGQYSWANELRLDKAPPLPEFFLSNLPTEKAKPAAKGGEKEGVISEGSRNLTLTSVAGVLRRSGGNREVILTELLRINADRCVPPLPEKEVKSIVDSVLKYAPAKILDRFVAAEKERKILTWLWGNRIPLGKVTLIAGEADTGKSCFTLFLAAKVSTGEPWGDGAENLQGSVLLLGGEDDFPDTVGPRLDALKADCSRIHFASRKKEEERYSAINLAEDMDILEIEVKKIPALRLVVVDPISAYIGDIDSHQNSRVRFALSGLGALAQEYGFAVVAVIHLRKSRQGNASSNIIGSGAFNDFARQTWFVAKDPNDPERRLLLGGKHNLVKKVESLGFRLLSKTVEVGSEKTMSVPTVFLDSDPVSVSAENIYGEEAGPTKSVARAIKFLQELFKDNQGELLSSEIWTAASIAGITSWGLKTAKKKLGIRAEKRWVDGKEAWWWVCPQQK